MLKSVSAFNAQLLFFLLKESRVWSEALNIVGRNKTGLSRKMETRERQTDRETETERE